MKAVSFVDHVFAMLESNSSSWRLEDVQWLQSHPVMLQLAESEESNARATHALMRLPKPSALGSNLPILR